MTYEEVCRDFRWEFPSSYNLGEVLCRGGDAGPEAIAVIVADKDAVSATYSFGYLDEHSNRMANLLLARGHRPGDAIAVMLPQSIEAAVTYLAVLKAGMVCVPLVAERHSDAFLQRLTAARATGFVSTGETIEANAVGLKDIPSLIGTHAASEAHETPGACVLERLLAPAKPYFVPAATRPDDPAFIAFTSGSEGMPKGVIHAHRILDGILPTFFVTRTPTKEDRVWSHFDWGWLGGLLVALAAWRRGAAVVVEEDASPTSLATLRMLSQAEVTRIAISPTALRILKFGTRSARLPQLSSLSSGGEELDDALRAWAQEKFGVELSEIYGLTECSGVLGSGNLIHPRAGSLGRALPGQRVALLDPEGSPVTPGEAGVIAVEAPHPAMFLGYLGDEDATRAKFSGRYLLTGDMARQDEGGYFYYAGRDDDLIKVGGRRIGPGEIESAMSNLTQVADCAVVGIPDRLSGHRLVSWVQLADGVSPSYDIEAELVQQLRRRLPTHQIPHKIRFVASLPKTANGKVSRRQVRDEEIARSE